MVRNNLVENHAVPPQKVELVHEFIDTASILHSSSLLSPASVRRELNIAEDAWIVGSCGTTDLRKGVDLFIGMEKRLPRQVNGKQVHLVWVGRSPGRWESRQLEEMMASARLNNRLNFVGEKPDPHPYFASFDVFALTSREDPFPLVMLEAAAHSKPIVCFREGGGAPEFVGDDCGKCVSYLDVDQMGSAVETLLSDVTLARDLGVNARNKVVERHDVSVGAPRILNIIQRYLAH
jgi:glycosyltransferase involved in cell wall biosynthesis